MKLSLKIKSLIVSCLMLLPGAVHAVPAHVLIIRHAEKPADDTNTHLSPRGVERAEALAKLFNQENPFPGIGKPAAVFAASPKREEGSLRSIETATPIAFALGLKADDSYTSRDHKALANFILSHKAFTGKTILIVWTNDEIPKLAKHFGAENPKNWPKKSFDRVWDISYPQGENSPVFKNLPQKVLEGDTL